MVAMVKDPRGAAAQAIARALSMIDAAYWRACDAEGRAIDPASIHAPEGLLDDAYEIALQVEATAAARGMSWQDARALF
jgi:hypothetical protein